jgi:hypothetical protein
MAQCQSTPPPRDAEDRFASGRDACKVSGLTFHGLLKLAALDEVRVCKGPLGDLRFHLGDARAIAGRGEPAPQMVGQRAD